MRLSGNRYGIMEKMYRNINVYPGLAPHHHQKGKGQWSSWLFSSTEEIDLFLQALVVKYPFLEEKSLVSESVESVLWVQERKKKKNSQFHFYNTIIRIYGNERQKPVQWVMMAMWCFWYCCWIAFVLPVRSLWVFLQWNSERDSDGLGWAAAARMSMCVCACRLSV